MIEARPDITEALYILPPDAKLLPVSDLSERIRAKIGPVEDGHSVITRPGFRVTARLIRGPLAELIGEFRAPSLLTDAVLRFARAHDEDPMAMLDLTFDALATLIEARLLVAHDSPEAAAPEPSLGAGQEFAGFEIESLVRSLEDSEVFRARGADGGSTALKVARDDRPAVAAMLANETRMLEHLGGTDSPGLVRHGTETGRAYIAMDWCEGVSIAVVAQQARAARDRRRLHALVTGMLDAYGRLHAKGVLHGDIHPGNCLVDDDGGVVILDFGNARLIDDTGLAVDPARAGIPQFHDPLMAGALLSGSLPPAATPASEQYAIAGLAYLLLTGLHPIEAPAVQNELLRRIVERPPLPFVARGVAAWPEVEAVIARGLAKRPEERFPDVTSLAGAFASADVPPDMPWDWPKAVHRAFDAAVEEVRSLSPSADSARDQAWFALRAALALEDAELLAAADVLARRLGPGWGDHAVASQVARARSDRQLEAQAITGFLGAVEPLPDGPEAALALLAAASVLDGATFHDTDAASLASWAAQRLDRLMSSSPTAHADPGSEPTLAHAALALVKSGTVVVPAGLASNLTALGEMGVDNVWLWALAHDILADDRFKALALAGQRSTTRLADGLALLRRYQLTGDTRWLTDARHLMATAPNVRLPEIDTALLMAELKAPEQAILPPFPLPAP